MSNSGDRALKEQNLERLEALSKGLTGMTVKLSNGDIDYVMGAEMNANSTISVLTHKHGWFMLATGKSLANGSARNNSIVEYYAAEECAE